MGAATCMLPHSTCGACRFSLRTIGLAAILLNLVSLLLHAMIVRMLEVTLRACLTVLFTHCPAAGGISCAANTVAVVAV